MPARNMTSALKYVAEDPRQSTKNDPQYLTEFCARHRFLLILAVFATIDLLSWPILFSMQLWIFGDRGSFLNVDYLLSQKLRLGVDACYAYGLMPVFIQHWLFVPFGMSYWPMIGCAVATLVLMAWCWSLFLRHFPREIIWLAALLATCHIIHWVNPNFPYSLVQLSLLFSLLFVLSGRMDIGLAVACVGVWSVPSIPLVLMALLAFCILLDWWMRPERKVSRLVRSLAPGVITYLALGVVLLLQFGWQSVMATATPLAGMKFYRTMHYGGLGSSIVQFVHPPYHTTGYYFVYTLGTPAGWWAFSVVSLSLFGILALRRMYFQRAINNRDLAIVLCAIVHGVFVGFAYGATTQHEIYDPMLVMGMLLGLSALPAGRIRRTFLAVYICLAVVGQANFVREDLSAWKEIRSSSVTANLYAAPDWVAEWKKVLDISTHENLFLLSYSTGIHDYFPTVHSADVWFLNPGELYPADKDRVMSKLRSADIVVTPLFESTVFVDNDPDVQQYLKSLCLTQSMKYFQVWSRRESLPANQECLAKP